MSGRVVGRLEEVPIGEGRAFVVDGEMVAVFRLRDGSLRALGATCPHQGGPLADGLVDGQVVVCPLHGFSYDLATGAELTRGGTPVRAYDAAVAEDGTIRVRARPS